MDDKFWYLKRCDLFERLTSEQIARVESRSKTRSFERNSLVYVPSDENDSLLLLGSGRVKIYHNTSDGKQALLAIIDPGELFGELGLVQPGRREESAEAMERSTVVLIPRTEVQRLMEEHPNVSLGVTKLIGVRLQRVERRLKSLLFRTNRERVVHLLLELAEKYGHYTREGVAIGIKLSHQELANIIGSTRETVTVVLGDLQNEGSLTIKRRQLILTRLQRLADSIDVPVPALVNEQETLKRPLVRQPQLGS
jgi:CRP-like cAMP-binding protein